MGLRTSGCPKPCALADLVIPPTLTLTFAITEGTPAATPQTISCGPDDQFTEALIGPDPCATGSCLGDGPTFNVPKGSYDVRHDNGVIQLLNALSPLTLRNSTNSEAGGGCLLNYEVDDSITICGVPKTAAEAGAWPGSDAYATNQCDDPADCVSATCAVLPCGAGEISYGKLFLEVDLSISLLHLCCNVWDYQIDLTLTADYEETQQTYTTTYPCTLTNSSCFNPNALLMAYDQLTGQVQAPPEEIFDNLLPFAMSSAAAGEANTNGGCGNNLNVLNCVKGCTLSNGFWLGCGPNSQSDYAGTDQNRDEIHYAWNGGTANVAA